MLPRLLSRPLSTIQDNTTSERGPFDPPFLRPILLNTSTISDASGPGDDQQDSRAVVGGVMRSGVARCFVESKCLLFSIDFVILIRSQTYSVARPLRSSEKLNPPRRLDRDGE